jgi:membrane-bound lytic murein transglycosylase D
MRWNVLIVIVVCSILLGGIGLTGCSLAPKANNAKLQDGVEPDGVERAAIPSKQEEEEALIQAIQSAESHYAQGCEYYNAREWALAEQELDLALNTLLDADVDDETHYKLGKAYNQLLYDIHKLALKQALMQTMEQEMHEASADQQETIPADSVLDASVAEPEEPASNDETVAVRPTLGTFVIDETDPVIQKYIQEFSHENSQFITGIERAGQYLPAIQKIFAEYQLPEELCYVPLIESNFRVDAVSPTGAAGLWQFVKTTAKIYGLKIDKWVDERRDPAKETLAAAKYLTDLYGMLGDWDLALAGYYMGEYKVHNAIGQHRTRDIEELAGTKSFGSGAKQYVWRIKAAALLAKDPARYNVTVQAMPPLAYERLDVAKGQRLSQLAQKLGISTAQLQALNPELRTSGTPSGTGKYSLNVPVGISPMAMLTTQDASPDKQPAPSQTTISASKPASEPSNYLLHQVKRGETLAMLARQYGVSVTTIQDVNGITDVAALQIGQKLKIPSSGKSTVVKSSSQMISHTIQKGETLEVIAAHYNVSIETLKQTNKIRNVKTLQIGQILKVPLSNNSVLAKNQEKRMLTYQVKRGDSLSKIASTFGVSVDQLKEWNNFESTRIYPGSRIKVWY